MRCQIRDQMAYATKQIMQLPNNSVLLKVATTSRPSPSVPYEPSTTKERSGCICRTLTLCVHACATLWPLKPSRFTSDWRAEAIEKKLRCVGECVFCDQNVLISHKCGRPARRCVLVDDGIAILHSQQSLVKSRTRM